MLVIGDARHVLGQEQRKKKAALDNGGEALRREEKKKGGAFAIGRGNHRLFWNAWQENSAG